MPGCPPGRSQHLRSWRYALCTYQVSDEEAAANAIRFLQEGGAAFLLVEAVPPEVTAEIHKLLSIPVYSIGAGAPCDGQLTIFADTIGMFQAFTPKFIKKYAEIAPISSP